MAEPAPRHPGAVADALPWDTEVDDVLAELHDPRSDLSQGYLAWVAERERFEADAPVGWFEMIAEGDSHVR